jgi:NADPH-dependent 2,4-dienoyl-CoA reductase/sulfur reductase-like enzyme/nitrite reductase/ring-hydroxylating ferredoxin subunit
MPFQNALPLADLPSGTKKAVTLGDTEILLIHTESGALHAVEAKCPHAGAPLEKGAVCDGRLICPWHAGTFSLGDADGTVAIGTVLEPPPLRSLKRYEVRQEQGAILVNPEPVNAPSLASDDDDAHQTGVAPHIHVVTIGAGAAATSAVSTLRRHGFAGRITMVDPDHDEPSDRTNLSKMALAGKMPIAKLPLWTPEEKEKLNVERVLAKVTALDATVGTLTAEKPGAPPLTIHFDAALLATGGTPNTLGIPGEDLPQVHTLRHVHDLAAMEALLGGTPEKKKAVLIGDSFIAFEAASALTTRGVHVTLVCRSPQPFSRKFGEAPAHALVSLHQAHGVALKLGAEARSITAGTATSAEVTLKSGETLPADLVLVAVGVHPATGFDHRLPLEKDGGIPTDDTLRAGPKLWVAGDLASVGGTRIEHWRLAEQHGRNAALGMLAALAPSTASSPVPSEGAPAPNIVPFFWTAHFGKRFAYIGHAQSWDDVQVDGSLGDQNFLAYYLKEDKVEAMLGCGHDAAIAALSSRMHQKLTLKEARNVAANV